MSLESIKIYINNEEFEIPKVVNIKDFLTNNIEKYKSNSVLCDKGKIEFDNIDSYLFKYIVMPIVCDVKMENLDHIFANYFQISIFDKYEYFDEILKLIEEINDIFKFLLMPPLRSITNNLTGNQFYKYYCINKYELDIQKLKLEIINKVYEIKNNKEIINPIKSLEKKYFDTDKIYSELLGVSLKYTTILYVDKSYVPDNVKIKRESFKNVFEKINNISDSDDKNILLETRERTFSKNSDKFLKLLEKYNYIENIETLSIIVYGMEFVDEWGFNFNEGKCSIRYV